MTDFYRTHTFMKRGPNRAETQQYHRRLGNLLLAPSPGNAEGKDFCGGFLKSHISKMLKLQRAARV
jgi:hypothetical protein